jgi:ribosome biogenesis GTPase
MKSGAIVLALGSGRCRVFFEGREIDCLIPAEFARQQSSAMAVGDRVVIEPADGGVWRVREVLPRTTVLARPDPLQPHKERLVAANVDLVVNVVSVKAPPLRVRLIDRYLIAIMRGGAAAAICVNKVDLLTAAEREEAMTVLEAYRDLDVPIVPCSTKTGEGLDRLRDLLRGRVGALVGHSGVGKSSLLNALDERLQIATGDLHKRGTGRHTTTSSTLHDLGDDTYVIDTPGIREFGLWDITAADLRDYFPDFAEASESCRFNDCSHTHEPHCEVKDRVESGAIARARYDTYLRLMKDLEGGPV